MRVALISKARSDAPTGLAGYDRGLYAGLRQIHDAEVVILNPETFRVPGEHWLRTVTGLDVTRFLQTYPIRPLRIDSDVLHLTSQTLTTSLWWRPDRPAVVTVHDIFPFLYRANQRLGIYAHPIHRVFDLAAMRLLGRAAGIITDSLAIKRDLVKYRGLNPDRIDVVPLGVDHQRFRPTRVPGDFWARHDLPPGGQYVLHVSSDEPRKDIENLLRAWQIVVHEQPSVILVKLGGSQFPRERQRLLSLVGSLGLQKNVRFLDAVSEPDLAYFYSGATVFAFPSLAEGFVFPVLEALACGTPVVCSDIDALRELVAEAAIRVPVGESSALAAALLRLLRDRGLCAELRQAGLERARQFTWEQTAEATYRVYTHVLGQV